MSIGFLVCAVPDAHIAFLREHLGSVHAYLEGAAPSGPESVVPAWWPEQPPSMHDSWSVNHGNTDLYHWILNGGPELVSGAGAIFQSWHAPDHPACFIKLDPYNERFALESSRVNELKILVDAVDVAAVMRAFVDWCKSQGKRWEDIDQYACEPFVDEFKVLGRLLDEALRERQGIVW